jgi:hypothetical protein
LGPAQGPDDSSALSIGVGYLDMSLADAMRPKALIGIHFGSKRSPKFSFCS